MLNKLESPYKSDECEKAFKDLLDCPKDPDLAARAMETTLPIFGQVLRTKFKGVAPCTEAHDEVISSVPMRLYKYLMGDAFYERYYWDPDTHKSFMFTWYKYEILGALARVRKKEKKREEFEYPAYIVYHPDACSATIECRVFIKELPTYILNKCKVMVRFSGKFKRLCDSILEKRVNSSHLPDFRMKEEFGLSDAELKFFDQYCRTLVKRALLDSRKMISRMPWASQTEMSSHREYDALNSEMGMHGRIEHW